MDQSNTAQPKTADQLTAVTGVHLMQGIGHRPAEGFWTEAWRQVLKRPLAVLGLAWVGVVAFLAVAAPLLASGHPIALVEQPGVHPLAHVLAGVDDALISRWGSWLLGFTVLAVAAWVLPGRRTPKPVQVLLGVLAAGIYALRLVGLWAMDADPDALAAPVRDVLAYASGAIRPRVDIDLLLDIAALLGLAWAASALGLSRRARAASAAAIPLIALGVLLARASDVQGVRWPLLAYLTAVDLVLLLGAVVALVLLVPRWWQPRSARAAVVLTASLQVGLTLLAHAIVAALVAQRDVAPWLRRFEQMSAFETLAALAMAALVGLVFVAIHPLDRITHRLATAGLVAATMTLILSARWSTPLPRFDYASLQAQGQISAVYTLVPWSPQQGGTALDLLPPGSSPYSQVGTGLRVDLDDLARDRGVVVDELPVQGPVLEALEARLGFARRSLPSDPQLAMDALRQRLADTPGITVAQAVDFLETLPAPRYVLGTDSLGQDVLSQMLHACRLSISIGLVSTAIAVVIGVTVGALMGYFGGWTDLLLYRLVEVFMAIPLLFLLIVAAAVLPKNTYVMMAIIGCVTWTGSARFIRAEFYKLRGQDFVQAARAVGLPLRSVLFKHMLPNGVTPVLVDASFAIAAAILAEAVLSYLGLGPANQASWGRLLSDANNQVGKFIWWLAIFPGLAIFLTVLSYNLIGEALRDAIDPKLKKARV
ncbi:MAG: hypothetical protein KatS3mg103_1315 [Phycisphaerales bacterium]|nr:MAG: hypothetical protein KatS3mg103_1315 [Phycisphaerales bacterium]